MSGITVNQGTQTTVKTRTVASEEVQAVYLNVGTAADNPFSGTILEVSKLATGTVSVNTPGTITSGSIAVTAATVTSGSIVVTDGTVKVVTPGTITSGSIAVTAGTITSGSIVVTDGTVKVTTPGTITSGSIVVTAGTISAGTIKTIDSMAPYVFDTITASYPSGSVEAYAYALGTSALGTVTVTYTDTTKGSISTVVKTP